MDKYDQEVEWLTELQTEWEEIGGDYSDSPIYEAWNYTTSPLFEIVGTSTYVDCGCLTQVHSGHRPAENEELTYAIRADKRIPDDGYGIKIENLHVFAEWRRKLDSMGLAELA